MEKMDAYKKGIIEILARKKTITWELISYTSNFKEFIDYANNKFIDLKIITNATSRRSTIHKIFQ